MRTSEEVKLELDGLKAKHQALVDELGKALAMEYVADSTSFTPIKAEGKPFKPVPKPSKKRAPRATKSATPEPWTADNRARRVPNWVIEKTGLDTKKAIVSKYGEGAHFNPAHELPPMVTNGVPAQA